MAKGQAKIKLVLWALLDDAWCYNQQNHNLREYSPHEHKYHISLVIRQLYFFLSKQSQKPRWIWIIGIVLEGRRNRTFFISDTRSEFHKTDLDIFDHSSDGKHHFLAKKIKLTLKGPIGTAADNIHKYFFIVFQKKIRLYVSNESSVWQRIHMKNQALYSLKDKNKKLKCRLLQFLFGA